MLSSNTKVFSASLVSAPSDNRLPATAEAITFTVDICMFFFKTHKVAVYGEEAENNSLVIYVSHVHSEV